MRARGESPRALPTPLWRGRALSARACEAPAPQSVGRWGGLTPCSGARHTVSTQPAGAEQKDTQHTTSVCQVSWVTSTDQLLDPMLVPCWALGTPACPPPPGSWVSPCGRPGRSCVPACASCPGPAGSQPAQHLMRGRSLPRPGWLLPAFARVPSAATVADQRSAAGPPVGGAMGEETG